MLLQFFYQITHNYVIRMKLRHYLHSKVYLICSCSRLARSNHFVMVVSLGCLSIFSVSFLLLKFEPIFILKKVAGSLFM